MRFDEYPVADTSADADKALTWSEQNERVEQTPVEKIREPLLRKSANLGDLEDPAEARENLGLEIGAAVASQAAVEAAQAGANASTKRVPSLVSWAAWQNNGQYLAYGNGDSYPIVNGELQDLLVVNLGASDFVLEDENQSDSLTIAPFEAVLFSTADEGGGDFSFAVDVRRKVSLTASDVGAVPTGTAVLLTTNQTAGGDKTFSGRVSLTGQPAASSLAGTDGLTKALGDALYLFGFAVASDTSVVYSENTTLTDVTGSEITGIPAGLYLLEVFTRWFPASSTPGIKQQIVATNIGSNPRALRTASGETASAINVTDLITLTGSPARAITLRGLIRFTATGTLKLQGAQNTSSTDTTTLSVWSINLRRIGA